MTRIGNHIYVRDTLNRVTIVRLTQIGLLQIEIRRLLKVSKPLVSKWANYDKMEQKKKGRPEKFTEEEKNFIYNTSEGKLTVINKTSSRNISNFLINLIKQLVKAQSIIFF